MNCPYSIDCEGEGKSGSYLILKKANVATEHMKAIPYVATVPITLIASVVNLFRK
jgi:hypothetical protein